MEERLPHTLLAALVVPVLMVCFFTGGAFSPFRLAFFPLMMLLCIRLSPRANFLTGILFACGYAAMVIYHKPADRHAMVLAVAEFFFYLAIAWSATCVARTV